MSSVPEICHNDPARRRGFDLRLTRGMNAAL